jgi:hypothetical protein
MSDSSSTPTAGYAAEYPFKIGSCFDETAIEVWLPAAVTEAA